jgi:hypothetical protein
MPWILAEDKALKKKLQGMTVTDAGAATLPGGVRPVGVRYRLPEDEIAVLNFPIVIIDPPRVVPAPDREHRADTFRLPYAPEGYPLTWDPGVLDNSALPYRTDDEPIPYYLDYEITLLCRLARDHFYPLIAQLAGPDRIPYRNAYLDIPEDQTRRNMMLLGNDTGTATFAQKDGDNKRLFRASYLVRVFTELVGPITVMSGYPRASEIEIDLSVYSDINDINEAPLTEMTGVAARGASVGWNTLAAP